MSRYRNAVLFLVLSALWGSAFVAIEAGLAYFPPVLFAALRFDIAGTVMGMYAWYAVADPLPRSRDEWAVVAVGAGLVIAAYHAFLFVGEADPTVTSAAAAVIVSLNPVLTSGFARLFLPGKPLGRRGVAGLLLSLVGAVVLANPDPADLLAGGLVAKLLVFAAVASFAAGSVATERLDTDLAIESMEAWSMVGGAVALHAIALWRGESLTSVRLTVEGLLALGFLSLAASVVGFLIYFDLLDRLGSVEINLVSYVAPVFAAITAWVFLGTEPTVATVAGFVLIFGGFLVLMFPTVVSAIRAVGE